MTRGLGHKTLRTFRALVFAELALSCIPVVTAETLPTFRDVDFFYSQNPQRFKDLWQAAESQTVRIAVLGDSQETNPTSHGFQYMPLLNYEMWKRFGNSPETPIAGCFDYGPSPPAAWLTAGRCTTPGPTTSRLSASQILPNARPSAFSTINGSTNITGGTHGQLTMLEHDASGVHPSAEIPTNVAYFDTSGIVKARIFAATNASSGEIAYRARPNATASPAYSAAVTTTGTLALALQSQTFAIKAGNTAALDFDGKRYMALEVFGNSDTKLTDIVGLRFFNETHPEGVVIDTFSLGGYSAATFLQQHANAGAMFRAFGFHAAVIHYGANEGGDVTAEQFKANLTAMISRLRTWVGDSTFPVILIADVYQSRLSPAQFAEYDQYVGAQLSIAQADSNVMVINARRLTEDIGWNEASGQSAQYLEDGVHYTALGAQVLSATVVSAMMGEIHVSGCTSDPGAVSLRSTMTLVVDVGGTTPCTSHGQLRVARSLTLKQPALEVVLEDGFTPAEGDTFKLFAFAAVSGSFGNTTLPSLPSELSWDTSELDTTGTIKVVAKPIAPPPPPTPPTITVTSGASQTVTLPSVPAPIAFTVSGSSELTVTASSSNTLLLPNAAIAISPGCGTATLSCTATLSAVSGQVGSSIVSVTVTDADGQAAVATATVDIKAEIVTPPPPPPASPPPDTGAASGSTSRRGGGGGGLDLLSMLGLVVLLSSRAMRAPRTAIASSRISRRSTVPPRD